MNKIFYIALMIYFISAMALANPLPVGGPGKTIVPYLFESNSISLEEEIIFIKVNEEKEIPSFIRDKKMTVKCIRYDCIYFLKNLKNEKITLNVGFPFYDGHTNVTDRYGAIDDFQVYQENKKIKPVFRHSNVRADTIILKETLAGAVDFQLVGILIKKKLVNEIRGQPDMFNFSPMGLSEKNIIKILKDIDFNKKDKEKLTKIILENLGNNESAFKAYKNWYYFSVTFKPNSVTKLHITYNSMKGNYDYRSFYYVLKTGTYWNGTIGKCIVNINFGKNDNLNNYKIRPAIFKILDNNSIQFEWVDFIPVEDIFIDYIR